MMTTQDRFDAFKRVAKRLHKSGAQEHVFLVRDATTGTVLVFESKESRLECQISADAVEPPSVVRSTWKNFAKCTSIDGIIGENCDDIDRQRVVDDGYLLDRSMVDALCMVRHAIRTDDLNEWQGNVWIEPFSGGMKIWATDGHRMARVVLTAPAMKYTKTLRTRMSIPRRVLDVILSTIKGRKTSSELELGGIFLRFGFRIEDWMVLSWTRCEQPANVEQIWTYAREAEIGYSVIYGQLDVPKSQEYIRISFSPGGVHASIDAVSKHEPSLNVRLREELRCFWASVPPKTKSIVINADYFAQCLKALGKTEPELRFGSDASDPVTVSAYLADGRFESVIMPVRL